MFGDIQQPNTPKKKASGGREQISTMSKPLKPEETVNLSYSSMVRAKKNRNFLRRLRGWWSGLDRNLRFAIISLALLLFTAGALGYYFLISAKSEPVLEVAKGKPKPTTVASPLTGVQVQPELAQRPVTAIMIENSVDARPQSGLMDAGVVFEAIAEGGITRFIVLFQEGQPQYIGPVRSLRPYYIDWAMAYDAPIAHIGGSPDALSQIRSGGKDLDQFFNPGSYWRQSTRASPHNVYTSFERLDALNKAKGYTSSKFDPWERKSDKPQSVPAAKTIKVNVSSGNYNSHYDYDAGSNSYLRSQGGRTHIVTSSADDKTGQQLRPKTVIVLIMPYSLSGKYSVYATSGSGAALIFQDGGVTEGKWTKKDRASQFKFTDAAEKEIKFNAGQSWVTVVASRDKITYEAAPPPPPPPPTQ